MFHYLSYSFLLLLSIKLQYVIKIISHNQIFPNVEKPPVVLKTTGVGILIINLILVFQVQQGTYRLEL